LLLLVALLWAVAAGQGLRVRRLREAEMFYRWILSEATGSRVFDRGPYDLSVPGTEQMMDSALLKSIEKATDPVLPEVALTDQDVDAQGQPLSKLVRLVRDGTNDRLLWQLARGPVLQQQREDFFHYLRKKQLETVASVFDPNAVYAGEGGANVSIGNIFFGFRKIAANFVWLQVDKYYHQGMMHRMVPLMNTCVALDPHFVDAYLLGAWHLAYNATAHMIDTPEPLKKWYPKYKARLGDKELYYYMGIDFLKDGIFKNPRNYKLYFDLGFGIYKTKLQDYANAVLYLSEAIRHRHDKWVPRQLYQCLELNGQYEEALAGWERYLKENPDNLVAPRFILRNKGLMKERAAEQAQSRAEETEDPLAAQAARVESEDLENEARAIWKEMNEPFAEARLLRLDALKCIQEKRYVEAIAYLEHARWESSTFFDEATDLIIQTKQKAGIPLSKSEAMAVIRKEEAEKYEKLDQEQLEQDEREAAARAKPSATE